MPAGSTARLTSLLPAALIAAAGAAALAWSNPGPADFESFAAERLVVWISDELCRSNGLPLSVQLLVRDCPQLVRGQRRVLGQLAAAATHRYNAGLFSLYVTELGGQSLLPGLALPRYRVFTLAGAGQFSVLQASGDTTLQER